LFDVELGDADGGAAAVEFQDPVGLREEMVEFFDAFV